ncbi:hypothetical protein H5410_028358 [Solanum commersonii]|uniref:Uncharacterized protein n=1 Tax=Solanum commersonii TaxID=4109 RepID=A0A9J5Z2G5_SOLCO|nr:hypothetical protein H5410_028358 [Solanum commersonii]
MSDDMLIINSIPCGIPFYPQVNTLLDHLGGWNYTVKLALEYCNPKGQVIVVVNLQSKNLMMLTQKEIVCTVQFQQTYQSSNF